MKKDKYSVFKLDDYTSQQLGYLRSEERRVGKEC